MNRGKEKEKEATKSNIKIDDLWKVAYAHDYEGFEEASLTHIKRKVVESHVVKACELVADGIMNRIEFELESTFEFEDEAKPMTIVQVVTSKKVIKTQNIGNTTSVQRGSTIWEVEVGV